MTNTYPYAPLLPREIPQILATASFQYGIDMMSAIARDNNDGVKNDRGSFALAQRLEADLRQAERGPLEAVTR